MASDGTPRFAASHQGQFCLSMSHKKDARLIWVNSTPAYLIKKMKTQFSSTLRSIVFFRLENKIFALTNQCDIDQMPP